MSRAECIITGGECPIRLLPGETCEVKYRFEVEYEVKDGASKVHITFNDKEVYVLGDGESWKTERMIYIELVELPDSEEEDEDQDSLH